MENFHEEEALVKEYDSKLMKRMLQFAKPYKFYIIAVMVMMMIVTTLDLSRTYFIKEAIDKYINNINMAYTILPEKSEESIKIGALNVIAAKEKTDDTASLIHLERDYYLVKGNVSSNKLYDLKASDTSKNQYVFTQDTIKYEGYKLTQEEVKSLRGKDAKGVLNITIYILSIAIVIFILNYIQIYILQYSGQRIVFNIRQKLFAHVEELALSFYDKNPVGRLVTRVTNDVETLNEMYTGVLVNLFKDVFLLSGIIIAMFLLNVKLALITVCAMPFIITAAILFKKYDRDAYREVRVRLSKINSSLSENISGMKVVQIFHKEDKKFKEFDGVNKSYLSATIKQLKVFAIFRPAIDFLSTLTMSALLWFGGMSVLRDEIPFGVLFAFISYMMQFFQPIFDLTEKYDILQSSMASAERIFMLLDNETSIKNPEKPIAIERLAGEIEFRNVWFAYNAEQWVLRDVSFKIKPGEKIAFVGATGAGKTSIISLICRLYDIQKGEILIDGVNIKDMDKYELRKNVATVLQDVFLFTGDIKSNVRLNNKEITDEDIINSCSYVNADKFIEKLSDKYDNYVNERGTTFSQGERQLIAFARAIAFNPPILVLDEATSNIDTETESLIQDALTKITKNRTTIVVAHRLSTIKNCDKIIVLHKGKIREFGTHEELLERGELYYNLYKLQYAE
jgi:ABC-type multidrug transport system fused ATPase/permease subunit